MPRKVVEDSDFSFKVDSGINMPKLPNVPIPPMGRPKKVLEKPPKRVDCQYIESEIKKIEFYIDNRMVDDAKAAHDLLQKVLHQASKDLKEKFQYDLKRIETAIELIGL